MYSPARSGGRNLFFCSSVPTWRIVLPTMIEFPRPSSGAPASRNSSFMAVISYGSRACPPYSTGQEAAIHPRSPMARCRSQSWAVPVSTTFSNMSSLTCSAMKACTSSRKASLLSPNRKSINPLPRVRGPSPPVPSSPPPVRSLPPPVPPRRAPGASSRHATPSRRPHRAEERVGQMLHAPTRIPGHQRPGLGPPVVEPDVVLEHVPVAPMDVQSDATCLLGRPGCEQERHAGQGGELVGGLD